MKREEFGFPGGWIRARALRSLAAAGLGLLALAPGAWGRINLVTLPGRDTVQLTIYNSADLTLVKETRTLTFKKGLNRLEFSWANTLIDPTSVEFRALSRADAIEVLDVSFPPRVANTLEWRIQSEAAGEAEVEIRYFTSGIGWAADYVAEGDRSEKTMTLAGQVRVTNNSGEDYENAQMRLVVGVIRLVEEIAQLARQRERLESSQPQGMARRMSGVAQTLSKAKNEPVLLGALFDQADKDAIARPREVIKEEMGEYFLYTVEGRADVPTGWSKRLPSFKAAGTPIASFCKFEKERWGDAVQRYWRFTNSAASGLGKEPLPDGAAMAFRLATDDRLCSFLGRTQAKYIPIGETVDLELGADPELRVKATLLDWEKTDMRFDAHGDVKGWTTRETWQLELQNSRALPALLDARRNFSGDWSLETVAPYEKLDAAKVKFLIPLQPREIKRLAYTLTTRHGLNATR